MSTSVRPNRKAYRKVAATSLAPEDPSIPWRSFLVFSGVLLTVALVVAIIGEIRRAGSGGGGGNDQPQIRTVHIIFSNHLDVGFNDVGAEPPKYLAADVITRYNTVYFQRAIDTVRTLSEWRGNGTSNATFVWTTHSWLVSLFLDCPIGMNFTCPDADAQTAVRRAIADGNITFHAFPFNAELEMFTPELVAAGIDLSQNLAKNLLRPGPLPNTISQRDVPGTTRAIIPILAAKGVIAMSIGTNGASAPVAVPSASIWRHTNDTGESSQIYLFYHARGYGGVALSDEVRINGYDSVAVFVWNGDNSGPFNATQVNDTFALISSQYPNATVIASTFERFVVDLDIAYQAQNNGNNASTSIELSVFDSEMGDTWIHGTGNDPLKVAQWRALSRLHADCVHQSEDVCESDTVEFANFTRLLLKGGEHTWGADIKQQFNYSGPNAYEYFSWRNDDLTSLIGTADYQNAIRSWIEQRLWAIDIPLSALPPSHRIVRAAADEFAAIVPRSWQHLTAGYTWIKAKDTVFTVGRLSIQFDDTTGGISSLIDTVSGRVYADGAHRLGELVYQTFSEGESYQDFINQYASTYNNGSFGPWYMQYDFGKRGLDASAKPQVQSIYGSVVANGPDHGGYIYAKNHSENNVSFIIKLAYNNENSGELQRKYGAPQETYVLLDVVDSQLSYTVLNRNKQRTRLPEALWFHFNPLSPTNGTALVKKIGSWINPAPENIFVNGSAHLHALSGAEATINVTDVLLAGSRDVALVCIGTPTPFPTPLNAIVGPQSAFSFGLWNNIWGTNYPAFYPFVDGDLDQQYRFEITLQ